MEEIRALRGQVAEAAGNGVELVDVRNAGATGLSFARCRVGADAAASGRVLVHAAPRHLEVVVRDDTAPWSPRATSGGEAPSAP